MNVLTFALLYVLGFVVVTLTVGWILGGYAVHIGKSADDCWESLSKALGLVYDKFSGAGRLPMWLVKFLILLVWPLYITSMSVCIMRCLKEQPDTNDEEEA